MQSIDHYQLRLNGHILDSTFYSYWNADIFETFTCKVKVSLIRLRGQEWGSLTDLRQWQGGDNEFLFAAKSELNRLVAAGSSHAAYVIQDDSPHLDVLNEIAPTLSGYTRRVFNNKADAVQWLKDCGFKMPLESTEHCEQGKD